MFRGFFRNVSAAIRKFGRAKLSRQAPHRRLTLESLECRKLLSVTLPQGVSDGSFEAPALAAADFRIAPDSTPWQFAGTTGITSNGSAFTGRNPAAPVGSQVGLIKNNGSISQTVRLESGVYNIQFLAAQRAIYQTQNQTLEVLFDGVSVGVVVPSGIGYANFQTQNFPVTAGTHTIMLRGLSPAGGDSTAFIDQVAAVSVANGLINGGFEQPSLPLNSYQTQPSGTTWQFSVASGVARNGSDFVTDWVQAQNAPSGTQVGYLQGTGSINQTIHLDGGRYYISLLAAQRAVYQSSYQEFAVQVDGATVGTIRPVNTLYGSYQTSTFTVADGTHTIRFIGLNPQGGDNTAFIDQVMIVGVGIEDAGFETPALASGAFQMRPTGSPWQFAGSSGLSANGSQFTAGNPGAPVGSQVAFVKNGGTFSQSMFLASGSYNVSFQAAQRANYQTQNQVIQVLVDGNLVGSIAPSGTSYNAYQTPNFHVSSGTHAITFQGATLGGDSTAFIDLVAVNAAQNTLADESFETPVQPAYSFTVAPGGCPWQFSGIAGISGNGSSFTAGNSSAVAGTQVAFIKNDGAISQTVYFDAGAYNLAFFAAQRGNYQTQPQQVQVLVDGAPVSVITPADSNYSLYQTANFYVAAGPHTIQFRGLSPQGADSTALIDKVALAAVTGLLSDASFEVPVQASNSFQVAPTGAPWQFSGTAGVSGNGSSFTAGNSVAPFGTQVGFLKNNGSMSQSVYLEAGRYNVSFYAAQRGNYQLQAQQIAVLVDGNQIGTITPADASYTFQQTPDFQVGSGMHTVQFLGLGPAGGDSTAFLDGTSINDAAGINDGSFERPVLAAGAYQFAPTGTAWQFAGTSGVSANSSAFTIGNPNAPGGAQVGFIKGTGSISQSIYLEGGLYNLAFYAAQRATSQSQYQSLAVLLDGVQIGTATPPDTSFGLFQTNSFTVATGIHTISFVGLNPLGGDNTVFIDGVQV